MAPLKEFAQFIILNMANLVTTYTRLLRESGKGYETFSADSCTASARRVIQAVVEACETQTSDPLFQIFEIHPGPNRRWIETIIPPQPVVEIECLGQTLLPVLPSLEAGQFLWQMLAEVRRHLLAAAELAPAALSRSAEPALRSISDDPVSGDQAARYRRLFEHSHDAIYVTYPTGEFLDFNQALLDLVGYTQADMQGLKATSFYADPSDRVRFRQLIETTGSVRDFECKFLRKDGTEIDCLVTGTVERAPDGQVITYQGIIRDVTERKQVEQALAEERNLLRTFIDNMPSLAYAKDLQGRFIVANPAIARSFETSLENLIGKSDFDFHPRRLAEQFYAREQEMLRTGQPLINLEEEVIDPAGNSYWLSSTKVPLRDRTGRTIGLVGIGYDITGQKQTEQVLAKRAAELETVARVSTAAASILEPEQLLQEVVDLAKSGFELYHTHIYLLDESEKELILAAGAGEVGRQMVAQDWRIPLEREQSLVARAARERQGIIVNDVQAEPDFLPNPLLPETRAELAVPVMLGERLQGVLDVQAAVADYFTAADIQIQTTLAAQIAVALQNAREHAQTQRVLSEIQASQKLLRSIIDATPDWIFIKDREHRYQLVNQGYANSLHLQPEDFLGKNDLDLGFPEDIVKGNPDKGIRGFWADDREVMARGEMKYVESEPAVVDGQPVFLSTIKVPLRDAAGQVWGVLGMVRDITQREQLLAEVERLAQRAQILHEASALMRQSLDVETILQTGLEVIGKQLGKNGIKLQLYSQTDNPEARRF